MKRVTPDDALLVNCDVAPPPSREELSILSYSKEERDALSEAERDRAVNAAIRAVTGAYMDQTSNLMICNKRLEKLREWKALQVGDDIEGSAK